MYFIPANGAYQLYKLSLDVIYWDLGKACQLAPFFYLLVGSSMGFFLYVHYVWLANRMPGALSIVH